MILEQDGLDSLTAAFVDSTAPVSVQTEVTAALAVIAGNSKLFLNTNPPCLFPPHCHYPNVENALVTFTGVFGTGRGFGNKVQFVIFLTTHLPFPFIMFCIDITIQLNLLPLAPKGTPIPVPLLKRKGTFDIKFDPDRRVWT